MGMFLDEKGTEIAKVVIVVGLSSKWRRHGSAAFFAVHGGIPKLAILVL
jgi:hypothetical protein